MGVIISSLLFQPPSPPTPLKSDLYFWLKTSLNSKIPAFYIQQPQARYSIIYSHGNAEDLGSIYEYLLTLSKLLYVNILAYDYSGYGLGITDKENIKNCIGPSEQNCYADIEAAYDHLTKVEGVSFDQIILYGRSLGSGPACYLAEKAKRQNKPLAGVVLHSPFLSVCRIVLDMGFTFSTDIFPNASRIENVGCPALIIHGTVDKIVPFSHGKGLCELIPIEHRVSPFWAEKMGHNNIEFDRSRCFIRYLQTFFTSILQQQKKDKDIPLSIVVNKRRNLLQKRKLVNGLQGRQLVEGRNSQAHHSQDQ